MKVIHVVGGLKAGGAEHMVLELCKCSHGDKAFDMEVVSLSNINEIAWKFEQEGIPLFIDQAVGNTVFKRLSQAFRALREVLRRKPHVVHAHMYHAALAAIIIRIIRPQTKIVFSLHNTHQPGRMKRLILFLFSSFRHKDFIFPGSPARWYLKKKAIAVPNGIDIKKFSQRDVGVEPITFLFAGRLEPQKNPLFLITLAKELRNSIQFKILVAGGGSLGEKMRVMVRSEQLEDSIEFLGLTNDIPALMKRSHCLLLPSLWEGMPLVLLEAGAAGLPVLATPMANELGLINVDTGYVATLENFGTCAMRLVKNYDEALARADSFRKKVIALYTIDHSYTAHRDIYLGMLSGAI